MRNGDNKKQDNSIRGFILLLFSSLFLYNAYLFLSEEGNNHPLVETLFNMKIILSFFIYICHKKDLDEAKSLIYKQTYLDSYFKRPNK